MNWAAPCTSAAGNCATRSNANCSLQAQGWFDRTLHIDPENLTAHYNLGLIHAQLGNS